SNSGTDTHSRSGGDAYSNSGTDTHSRSGGDAYSNSGTDTHSHSGANTNAYPYPSIDAACSSCSYPYPNSTPAAHLDTPSTNTNACGRACLERPVALRGRILCLAGIPV
ncbi:hypothetical protein, partial [Synechococcus sp. B60.2]|uniref:hypothetical protein n=1 Tax=Synechococcus sp. B60.2 TaxID=2964523 RepID=UPI0039C4B259